MDTGTELESLGGVGLEETALAELRAEGLRDPQIVRFDLFPDGTIEVLFVVLDAYDPGRRHARTGVKSAAGTWDIRRGFR